VGPFLPTLTSQEGTTMRFMNDFDIARHQVRHGEHPVLGPALETLGNLVEWTNTHSDGWSYWPKPARAAAKLMELIDGDGTAYYLYDDDREDATPDKLKAALRTVKAFRTRHGADFEIVESK
jgi:hypothetical protein